MTVPPVQDPSLPAFELPDRRSVGGWFVLIAIFSLMIGVQLSQYLKRGAEDPEAEFVAVARQLKIAVEMRQTMSLLGGKELSSLTSSFTAIEDDLEDKAAKNAIAARLFAASRSERGAEVPKDVLNRLLSSPEPRDRYFAEVFSAKTMDPVRVAEIDQRLAGGGFVSKLARIHAHEKAGDPSLRHEIISRDWATFRLSVIAVVSLAALSSLFLWVIFIIFKAQKMLPIAGFPLERISLPDADRLALRCAQIFVLFLVLPFLVSQLIGGVIDKHVGNLILYVLLLVGTIWLFRFPIGQKVFSLASLGITSRDLGKNVGWGVATAVANIPLVLATAMLGQWIFSGLPAPEHPTTVQIETGIGWFGTLVILFAASVGAPILEEIMFRGTLLPALSRVMGRPVLAIIVQGFIFAAIHPTGVPAWLPLATIGAMSGFLARQTGSLVPSIVMHAVHNFGTLMIAMAVLGNGS